MSLAQLKNLNVDRMDVDEAISLATMARAYANGYEHYGVSPPAWLTGAIETLDVEINRRRRDILQSRKRELEANLTQLRTRQEQRADAEAELARLNDALGVK